MPLSFQLQETLCIPWLAAPSSAFKLPLWSRFLLGPVFPEHSREVLLSRLRVIRLGPPDNRLIAAMLFALTLVTDRTGICGLKAFRELF